MVSRARRLQLRSVFRGLREMVRRRDGFRLVPLHEAQVVQRVEVGPEREEALPLRDRLHLKKHGERVKKTLLDSILSV